MTEADQLDRGAAAVGVSLTPANRDTLIAFAALLRKWNSAFNLVSRHDVARLFERHIVDALALVPLLRGPRVLDLGTGAGLPGIPLAIVCNAFELTLLDRSDRRMRFIRQAAIELRLDNVRTITEDFTSFRPDALFDTVVSRAVAKPSALWSDARDFLTADGQALFQVGSWDQSEFECDSRVLVELISTSGLSQSHRVLRIRRQSPTMGIDE